MEELLASFKPPKPLIFDHNAKLNLEVFLNHLDVYLKVTGLNPQDDVTKISIFLSHAGEEAQNKFYSFKLTDVQAKQYETVIGAFKEYCKPFKSETQERYKFFKRVQQNDENFDHFLTALKCLAKECNFGELEESLIRDKIISSMLDPSLQEELLRIPDVTLEIVENHCRTSESNKFLLNELAIRSMIKMEVEDVPEGGTNEMFQTLNSQSDNLTESFDMEKVKLENSDQQAAGSSNFQNTEIELEEFSIDVKGEPFESHLDELIWKYAEKRFVCATCDVRFGDRTSLIDHIKCHIGEKPHTCKVCGSKFAYKGALKRHLQTHQRQIRITCKICSFKCLGKVDLKRHLKSHAGQKPFACDSCGYKCWTEELLNLHLKAHAFACDTCEYRCSRKEYLKLHQKNHISKKSYSCEFCEANFEQKENLRSHLLTHAGKKQKKIKKFCKEEC